MSSNQKPSSGSIWPGIIVGIILMVAGTYVSVNNLIPFTETLTKQGLELDLGMTIATIGVFMILFPVIRSFFLDPLAGAINDRNRELEHTFSEAETLRADMQRLRNEYEQRLASTEAQAREQIQAQIREATNLRQTLMAEATQRADEMVARAQQEIEQEKSRVLNELRVHVVDLSLAAAEKIMGENMDSDRNRRLVQEFIDTAEVAR